MTLSRLLAEVYYGGMSTGEEDALNQRPLEADPTSEQDYRTREWDGENVFHIYPRTFNEERSDGEPHRGIGSILGIIEKLDWMQETGITAIWLGPFYKSPGRDGGYDISDYYQVDEDLGTLDDMKRLIQEAHARGIRCIADLVPNHTSDESEWFKASSNPNHLRHAEFADFYIWHDPVKGELPNNIVGGNRLEDLPDGYTVPNNWTSIFSLPEIDKVRAQHGGKVPEGVDIPAVTAWVWNKDRQQFYLAEFMKEQPSLNWNNQAVRDAMKDVVRFWLGLGIDGFRVDVMNHIGKDRALTDEDPAPVGTATGEYNPGTTNPHDQWTQKHMVSHWPELGEYVSDMLSILDEDTYRDRSIRFIFEDWMSALDHDNRLDQLRPDRANVFNFEMLLNTNREHWSAGNLHRIIEDYYLRIAALAGAVPNQVSGDHDVDTIRTRLGSAQAARAAYLMLAALPGMLYTWQGDALGRPNVRVPKEFQRDGDIGMRDGERVPIQWDASRNGGFSQAEPSQLWLPSVDPAVYQDDNLDIQRRYPESPYRFVQAVLLRRNEDPAFRAGELRMLHTNNPNVLAFARTDPTNPRRQVICIINVSADIVDSSILDAQQAKGVITLSSSHGRQSGDEEVDLGKLTLPPDTSLLIDSIA